MKKDRRNFRHGDRVRINANVGADGDFGGSVDFKGDEARVCGVNPLTKNSRGERSVTVQTEDGSFIAVPARALDQKR